MILNTFIGTERTKILTSKRKWTVSVCHFRNEYVKFTQPTVQKLVAQFFSTKVKHMYKCPTPPPPSNLSVKSQQAVAMLQRRVTPPTVIASLDLMEDIREKEGKSWILDKNKSIYFAYIDQGNQHTIVLYSLTDSCDMQTELSFSKASWFCYP